MKEPEFMAILTRLISVYSEKFYPSDRVNIIREKTKYVHPTIFDDAVTTLIGDNTHAPMLQKIQEAINVSRKKFPELNVDPHQEARKKLKEKSLLPGACYRCDGLGTVEVFQKWSRLSSNLLLCHCSSSAIAAKLPEYRLLRPYLHHDPFYYIFNFDPNKEMKFEIYSHLSFSSLKEAAPKLSEIYYQHDIHMDPCYWKPNGWVSDRPLIKSQIQSNAKSERELKREVVGYIESIRNEFKENPDKGIAFLEE